jgi:hypothetical protein
MRQSAVDPSSQRLHTEQALQQAVSMTAAVAAQIAEVCEAGEGAAQQELKLAWAVTTRSCAYLACANLAGEGGPAAGEGIESKRCTGCKLAWYCGTVCSHADWRAGGHRRVCKALAAAHAAQPSA